MWMSSFLWKVAKKGKILLLAYIHFTVVQNTIGKFLEVLEKKNIENFSCSFPAIGTWVKILVICELK